MTDFNADIASLGLPTLVVSDTSAQLESGLSASGKSFKITSISTYAEATALVSSSRFASVVVDLRRTQEFSLLLPRLAGQKPKPHLTVLASAQLAETIRAMPGVDKVLHGLFDMPDKPSEAIPEPETRQDTGPQLEAPSGTGPVQVLMFPRPFSSDFMPEDIDIVAAGTIRPEVIVLTEDNMARKLSMSLLRPWCVRHRSLI